MANTNRMMDIRQLMDYVRLGKNRASELGKAAGAYIKIGRRTLYDRKRIDEYFDGKGGKAE